MMLSRRVLVTGITSIHGWPIFQNLQNILPEFDLFGIRSPKMEIPAGKNIMPICITDTNALRRVSKKFRPTHVVHCAGVCDLDVCEERPDWARLMNAGGAQSVLDVFGHLPICYLSSDLVFSGNHPPKGGYCEFHSPDPLSIVGKTLLEAEGIIAKAKNHCIIRIGLPLGPSISGTKGAEDWIENRFKKNLPVTLFLDEVRSCPSCESLGKLIAIWLKEEWQGLFHFGGDKFKTLYEIGMHILKRGGHQPHLLKKMTRQEEKNGPPRIGNVTLNSKLLRSKLDPNSA